LHCNGRDEALGLPTETSAQIALRTQQVIASETGVINTVDPLAGSYAIESLTNTIEREAAAWLERIEADGGTLKAIERGMIQREIQESAYRHQQEIDSGERVVVGMNRYTDDAPTGIDVLRIDPAVERDQRDRVAQLRASRDGVRSGLALDAVTRAAQDGTNLMPPIITAVEARATVGEIADRLRAVFGEYREDGF
jgi:methylmalonyl-CoA mutase N-terminal domain/subunit